MFQPSRAPRPWRTLLAALAAGTCALGASAQSLWPLVEAARQHDAQLLSAQSELDAARSRHAQARAGLLPSAALQASVDRSQYRYHSEQLPAPMRFGLTTQTAGINASQPLYRPANRITLEQAEQAVEIAQAQYDAADQDLLMRVSTAYFDVLAAQDTLRTVEAQQAAVAEQLALAQRNFEVGTATITDAREAQARADLVEAQAIAARNDLRVKQLALEQWVGRTGIRPHALQARELWPWADRPELPAWIQVVENEQPQLRQTRLALAIARLETEKARTGHLPTVDLTAGYNVQRSPHGLPTAPGVSQRTGVANVAVSLNVPLFAGFAVQNRVRETLSLETKAEADHEHARRQLVQAVRAAYLGWESSVRQVQALEAAERSSQLALEANQLGYEAGVRVNIDVLNALSQLHDTRRQLAQARYQTLLLGLQLRQAAGVLGDGDVRAVDRLLAAQPAVAPAPAAAGTTAPR